MEREKYLQSVTKSAEKYCAYCGKRLVRKMFGKRREDFGVFLRRKYCGRDCMKKAFIKRDAQDQSVRNARQSADRIVYNILGKQAVCEVCGSVSNIDVHHIDGDPHNNSVDNLQLLCRSCHMKAHRQSTKKCYVCGAKVRGKGLCNKHYLRYRKFGTPYMYYHKIVSE